MQHRTVDRRNWHLQSTGIELSANWRGICHSVLKLNQDFESESSHLESTEIELSVKLSRCVGYRVLNCFEIVSAGCLSSRTQKFA